MIQGRHRMRRLIAIGMTVAAMANAGAQTSFDPVDLDAPGALARIEREHPDHFARIQRILAEVPRRPVSDDSVAKWMQAEFRATDVQYGHLMMTSYPPKKRLEFSLDRTVYVAVITLDVGGRPMALPNPPAK